MSADAKAKVFALLHLLSRTEAAEVAGRLTVLVGNREVSDAVTRVHRAVVAAAGSFPPLSRLQRLKYYKRFVEGAEVLSKFAEETCGPLGKWRDKVLYDLATCIVDDMKHRHVPLTVLNISCALSDVWGAVEAQLPGYLAAGKLRLVLCCKKVVLGD
jgi:hypothetical protein